jgi:hypothetical protein
MSKYRRDPEFVRGVKAAADFADEYNGSTTHDYRLGDCITCRLNVVSRAKPRRNKQKLPTSEASFACGMALALAEMHRATGDDSNVVEVAKAAGLTIAELRKAGVDGYDWRQLKKAGVP